MEITLHPGTVLYNLYYWSLVVSNTMFDRHRAPVMPERTTVCDVGMSFTLAGFCAVVYTVAALAALALAAFVLYTIVYGWVIVACIVGLFAVYMAVVKVRDAYRRHSRTDRSHVKREGSSVGEFVGAAVKGWKEKYCATVRVNSPREVRRLSFLPSGHDLVIASFLALFVLVIVMFVFFLSALTVVEYEGLCDATYQEADGGLNIELTCAGQVMDQTVTVGREMLLVAYKHPPQLMCTVNRVETSCALPE